MVARMTTLTPQQIKSIMDKANLDSRTVLLIVCRERVRSDVRKRFSDAAADLGIKLSRDFFADDSKKPAGVE